MKRDDEAPAVQIADRLEDAGPAALVYVDERGQVQSVNRYQWATVGRTGAAVGLLGCLGILGWLINGAVGVASAGAVAVVVLRPFAVLFRLRRAAELLVAERLDEAEAIARRVQRGWAVPTAYRASAESYLARIAARRGRHADALAFEESALRRLRNDRSSRSRRRMLEYARIVTLVNVDRVRDARAAFDGLPRALEGNYLRVQRTIAELYLSLAEGGHALPSSFLEEQAEIAQSLAAGNSLLSLLAWAEAHAGRTAKAEQLRAAAEARPGADVVRTVMPRLADWLDQTRPPR